MDFEFDVLKSESNKIKHGIDFVEGQELWKDNRGVEIPVTTHSEERYVLIARHRDRHWAAVYTFRQERIRPISIRRARLKEIAIYDNR